MSQQARWLDVLGEFDFAIEYRPGPRHGNADALSRPSCRSCVFCKSPEGLSRRVVQAGDAPVDAWSSESLSQAQRKDDGLCKVWELRAASNTAPPPQQVLGWCEAAKSYLAQWELLEMRAGVLYRRWVNGDERLRWLQLIPPVGLRHELMRMVHVEAPEQDDGAGKKSDLLEGLAHRGTAVL